MFAFLLFRFGKSSLRTENNDDRMLKLIIFYSFFRLLLIGQIIDLELKKHFRFFIILFSSSSFRRDKVFSKVLSEGKINCQDEGGGGGTRKEKSCWINKFSLGGDGQIRDLYDSFTIFHNSTLHRELFLFFSLAEKVFLLLNPSLLLSSSIGGGAERASKDALVESSDKPWDVLDQQRLQ